MKALLQLGRRLTLGGSGALLASLILMLQPLLGAIYLTDTEYFLWALLATAMTAGIIVDYGGPALLQHAVGNDRANRSTLVAASLVSMAGAATIAIPTLLVVPFAIRDVPTLNESYEEVVIAVLCTLVGAALRSAVVVIAALHLSRNLYLRRTSTLMGQAASQLLVCWILLSLEVGVWSLPLSLGVSSLATLGVVLPHAFTLLPRGGLDWSTLKLFATARGGSATLSAFLTQGDRWLVALVASTSTMQAYDIAARFALLPKAFITVFLTGIVTEAASAQTRADAIHLLRRSYQITAVALLLLSAMSGTAGCIYISSILSESASVGIALLGLLLTINFVHGMTAPLSLWLTGIGAPQKELQYLIPCALGFAFAGAIAVLTGDWAITITLLGLSLVTTSLWFITRTRVFVEGLHA